jgi:Domain of unknown function (DUF4340)
LDGVYLTSLSQDPKLTDFSMNSFRKYFLLLTVLTVFVAVLLTRQSEPVETSINGASLCPRLAENLSSLSGLEIVGAGNQVLVSLEFKNNEWSVLQKNNFPADTGKIKELVLMLANAKLLEPKTTKTEKYIELGVEDVSISNADSVLVKLILPNNDILSVIIGRKAKEFPGTYIRYPNDNQSWLSDFDYKIDTDPDHWIDKNLIHMPSDKLEKVGLYRKNELIVSLERTGGWDSPFKIKQYINDRSVTTDKFESIANFLSGLHVINVLNLDEGVKSCSVRRLSFLSKEGIEVNLRICGASKHDLLSLSAELNPRVVSQYLEREKKHVLAQGMVDANSAETTVDNFTREELAAEVDRLNHLFEGRLFKLPIGMIEQLAAILIN